VTHQSRSVTPAAGWDVEDFDVSGDGRYLAYVVDDDGRSRLTVLDTQAKLELAPVGLPEGRIGNLRFDRSGRRLALSAESALAPRDVYVYDLEHGKLERWTRSEPGPLDPSTLTTPELIHYPTWDRTGVGRHARMLSAYLYRPRTGGPSRSTARAGTRSCSFSSTSSATPWSRPTCAAHPVTARASSPSTTACCARTRCATSARCWCGSACSRSSIASVS